MSQKNSLLTFGAIAAIIIILIVGRYLGVVKPINEALAGFLSPIAQLASRAGTFFQRDEGDNKTLSELSLKLENLQTENRRLLVDNARLSVTEQENNDLREYLKFSNTTPRNFALASVIARDKSSESTKQQTIILDRGSKDGLAVGMPIVDTEGVLLGKITSVQDNISEGCLIFKDSCRLAVGLQGQKGTIGVLQSDLALTVKVDFIAHNLSLSEGQIIVTSGLEAGMPNGLVLGKISRIIKEGNELWQHALIEPLGNFNDIHMVAIIK
jgi:rod shape-determining protein MreC